MPFYVASYDLKKTTPDPYGALIDSAEQMGWSVRMPMRDGRVERIPNTTLVGTFSDLDHAVVALEAARQNAEVQLGGPVYVTGCYISEVIGDAFLKPKEQERSLSDALAEAVLRRNLS